MIQSSLSLSLSRSLSGSGFTLSLPAIHEQTTREGNNDRVLHSFSFPCLCGELDTSTPLVQPLYYMTVQDCCGRTLNTPLTSISGTLKILMCINLVVLSIPFFLGGGGQHMLYYMYNIHVLYAFKVICAGLLPLNNAITSISNC